MKREVKIAAADITLMVFVPDSTSTTGAGKTGLVYNTAGLVCWYARPRLSPVQVPLVTMTVTGAHDDGGFCAISAANMPGWYRLDMPDTPWTTGATTAGITLHGASGMAPVSMEIQLHDTATATRSQEFADAQFLRNFAMVESGAANGSLPYRNMLDAMRFLRNKWAITGGTLTVNKEDDTASAWTAAVTTTAGNPITTVDPA